MPAENANALEIRAAKESDVALVLSFIRKLADYGDLADEVATTESDVRSALFGPQHVAEAIIAYEGNQPLGFALYSFTFSSFLGKPGIYVEDFFVEESHRGGGIGKAMLVYLARLGKERGCGRLEWSALNWNERAMELYTDLGALPMDEWTTFRMDSEAMDRLAAGLEREEIKVRSRRPPSTL